MLFYLPNQLTNHHFGISVPRKLIKKATQRNYYKRQVKNILISFLKKNEPSKFFKLKHFDFVVIVRSGFRTKDTFLAKQESLTTLFNLILQYPLVNRKNYV